MHRPTHFVHTKLQQKSTRYKKKRTNKLKSPAPRLWVHRNIDISTFIEGCTLFKNVRGAPFVL